MFQKIKDKFHCLTNPNKTFRSFSFFEKIIFLILCFFEFFYRAIFFLITSHKKTKAKKTNFKVISVGNLSVGGTGKSVVVPFLLKQLGQHKCAVFLRGYGSKIAKTAESALVEIGASTSTKKFGDEAVMYQQKIKSPVVVGKNRFKSVHALEDFCSIKNKKIRYVILDDAYQNHQLKKNCEILLLDARKPFENGHCLPAGKLREKDFSRADVIIVTHADEVSEKNRNYIKKKLLKQFSQNKIFFGAHVPDGLYRLNQKKIDASLANSGQFTLATGVGSPEGVLFTVSKFGAKIRCHEKFEDHHSFSRSDVDTLLGRVRELSCAGVIVTEKDWVKLFPLIQLYEDWQRLPFFVVRVRFEFLSSGEYDTFMRVCKSYIC